MRPATADRIAAFLGFWGEVRPAELDLWCAALAPVPGDLDAALGDWLRVQTRRPMPAEIARAMVDALTPAGRHRALVARIAAEHGLDEAALCGRGQQGEVVRARHHAMAALLDTGCSTTQAGRLMGRDHTSIIHGARRHRARMAEEASQ